MSRPCAAVESVGEICLEPHPAGVRAVYAVEARTRADAREIEGLFRELESRIQVRPLCIGRLMGYAVQAHHSDGVLLDAIEDVLRESFANVIVQRTVDETALRVVADLCRRTRTRLVPVPHCAVCGAAEPFPAAVVSVSTGRGQPVVSRSYCLRCTAEASRSTSRGFIKSLLAADRSGLGSLGTAQIERRHSRGGTIRFKVKL